MIHIALIFIAFVLVVSFAAASIGFLVENWLAIWRLVLVASLVAFALARLSEAGASVICHPQTDWLFLPTLLKCD